MLTLLILSSNVTNHHVEKSYQWLHMNEFLYMLSAEEFVTFNFIEEKLLSIVYTELNLDTRFHAAKLIISVEKENKWLHIIWLIYIWWDGACLHEMLFNVRVAWKKISHFMMLNNKMNTNALAWKHVSWRWLFAHFAQIGLINWCALIWNRWEPIQIFNFKATVWINDIRKLMRSEAKLSEPA